MLAVTTPQTSAATADSVASRAATPRLYTWIADSGRVIEQVRLTRKNDGIRARGHIVAAADPEHIAFSLDYEAEVDASDTLRRARLTVTTEQYDRSIDLARDDEGAWLLDDTSGNRTRIGGPDVIDVDVTYSVFFAGVLVRRTGLASQPGEVTERVLAVDAESLEVTEDTVTFTSDDERVHGITATASTSATVDADGVLIDVSGLSRRA